MAIDQFWNTVLSQNPEIQAHISLFSTKIGKILKDNKLPFFPNYTDHGIDHIESVINLAAKRLVPKSIKGSDHLEPEDAAVFIGAAFLHDIAMHLREDGFLKLVTGETDHTPVPWFTSNPIYGRVDKQWPELWSDFCAEAHRFSGEQLVNIFGDLSQEDIENWSFTGLPPERVKWTEVDRLLVGEFIRRHHGRLAHEIALHGFPGVDGQDFPILAEMLPKLANLIGLVARSHSIPIRSAKDYLDVIHPNELRPRGCLALYHMALLRVSDYLQLEAERAPLVLLNLRDPQSRISVDEWRKHNGIAGLSFSQSDPHSVGVEISSDISSKIYFSICELLDDLQREIELSNALLSEVYGRLTDDNLNKVILKITRVKSNASQSHFLTELDFYPVKAKFEAHPKIVQLLIEPLYGASPSIAVRELTQNAIDAVVERRFIDPMSANDNDQSPDVRVELDLTDTAKPVLRLIDTGIGMDENIIANYFLKAGASFRESEEWQSNFTSSEGKARVIRAGKFGVGAFATFLLGDELFVSSCRLGSDAGIQFQAKKTADQIELSRTPSREPGTTIEIALSDAVAEGVFKELLAESWYTLRSPKVERAVATLNRSGERVTRAATNAFEVDDDNRRGIARGWHQLDTSFGDLTWTSSSSSICALNGIRVGTVGSKKESWRDREVLGIDALRSSDKEFIIKDFNLPWKSDLLLSPGIWLWDPDGKIPINLARDSLSGNLEFLADVHEDVLVDLFAYQLATAPRTSFDRDTFLSYVWDTAYPLMTKDGIGKLPHSWVEVGHGIAPLDEAILSQIGIKRILVAGTMHLNRPPHREEDESRHITAALPSFWPREFVDVPQAAAMRWDFEATSFEETRMRRDRSRGGMFSSDDEPSADERPASVPRNITRDIVFGLKSLERALPSICGVRLVYPLDKDGNNSEKPSSLVIGNPEPEQSNLEEIFLANSPEVRINWETAEYDQVPFVAEVSISDGAHESVISNLWKKYLGAQTLPLALNEVRTVLESCGDANLLSKFDKWVSR